MEDIFFVENINNSLEDNNASIVLFNASLFKYDKENIQGDDFNNSKYFKVVDNIKKSDISEIKQGSFIYFDFKTNHYRNANGSNIAKYFIWQNNIYRTILKDRTRDRDEKEIVFDKEVISYHVNVGHGNCSFVVGKNTKKVCLIDCSNYDIKNHLSYQDNIDACISEIIADNKMLKFHISKIFITHPHFDHYSGISTLIDKDYIDSESVFYINHWYTFANGKWNNLLQKIVKIKSAQKEPLSSNSSDGIEIIYPQISVVRTPATLKIHHKKLSKQTQIMLLLFLR